MPDNRQASPNGANGHAANGSSWSVIRVAERPRFTVVDRRAVNDDRLSFGARGLLFWMLDKPDGWEFDREAIAKAGPQGEHAVRTLLRELRENGYLVRQRVRVEGGRFRTLTMLYEVPLGGNPPAADSPAAPPAVSRPPLDGFPPPENRPANTEDGEPITDKRNPAAPDRSKPKNPNAPVAQELARVEWERRPTKPVGGKFVAFRSRIQEQLDAGHTPDELRRVLPTMQVFSANAFDVAWSRLSGNGSRPVANRDNVGQFSGASGRIDL